MAAELESPLVDGELMRHAVDADAPLFDAVGEAPANGAGIDLAVEHILDALGPRHDIEAVGKFERHQPGTHRIEGGAETGVADDLEIARRLAGEAAGLQLGEARRHQWLSRGRPLDCAIF